MNIVHKGLCTQGPRGEAYRSSRRAAPRAMRIPAVPRYDEGADAPTQNSPELRESQRIIVFPILIEFAQQFLKLAKGAVWISNHHSLFECRRCDTPATGSPPIRKCVN